MLCLVLECPEAEKDLIAAELWEHGTAGIVEEDQPDARVRLQAFFPDSADMAALIPVFASYGAGWHRAEDIDWDARVKDSWQPFSVGTRFFLAPAWRDDPAPEGRLRLEITPGMAFGTGTHATTQLSMEALETCLRSQGLVLDLGTGSGILARAAVMLGARRVVACDIDEDAVRAARENFRMAGLTVPAFAGSTRSVRADAVDLLLANINAETLAALAWEIARLLAPGGQAVLTGFPPHDRPQVEAAMAAVRLKVVDAREKDGWCALICQ